MQKVAGIGQSRHADYDHAVSSPDIKIEQITPNVYIFIGIPGCALSMVMTSKGAVFIDTVRLLPEGEEEMGKPDITFTDKLAHPYNPAIWCPVWSW